MESFGSFSNEEWECLSKIFSGDQDLDHFSSQGLFSSEQDHGLNFDIPSIVSSVMTEANNANSSFTNDHDFCYSSENIDPNFYHYFSQETSNNACAGYDSAASIPYPSSNIVPLPRNGMYDHEPINNIFYENNNISSLLAQALSDDSIDETLCLRQDVNITNSVDQLVLISDQHKHMSVKRKLEMLESPDAVEDKVNDEKPIENPKKKTRVSRVNVSVSILFS